MKEIMMVVLPVLCMIIAVALLFALRSRKTNESESEKETALAGNYMLEGMCLGMLAGLIIGSKFMTIGMLLGLLIGAEIKRESETNK